MTDVASATAGQQAAVAPGGTGATATSPGYRRRPWLARLRRDRTLIIMTLPALVLLAVFGYAPMLGLVMAFQDYDLYGGLLHSPWVGLANFQQLLTDPAFWHAFENTLVLFLVQLVLSFPVPIALAILVDSLMARRLKGIIQAIVTLPHFFSFVLVVTIFNEIFGGSGLLDTFLRNHGSTNPFNFMTNPATFKFLVTVAADLEGGRLADDRLPGRAAAISPIAVRGGRGRRRRLAGAACGTSRSPGSRASPSCC